MYILKVCSLLSKYYVVLECPLIIFIVLPNFFVWFYLSTLRTNPILSMENGNWKMGKGKL